jgi:uroporphyrinogen-III synthase
MLASIGPETTKSLDEIGLRPAVEARVHTLDGLVEAILNFQAASVRLAAAGSASNPS